MSAPSPAPGAFDDVAASLRLLESLPGVAAAQDRAREACTALRWHEALRRRGAEAAAESRIRGARASAALDGATVELAQVRDLVLGLQPWSQGADPVEAVVRGAVQATAESELLLRVLSTSPLQALARLHVAAASPLLPPDQLGRPRRSGEECREHSALGAPPDASAVPGALGGIAQVVLAVAGGAPALVAAAVAHAETVLLRPFVAGNAVVARALQRAMVRLGGLDPTGVAVVEAGHLRQGGTAYQGALAGYASGTPAGVAGWLVHCGAAMVDGAREGRLVADAVLAGRLA